MNSKEIFRMENKLTEHLKKMQLSALEIYIDISSRNGNDLAPSVHGMHAIIGSKNNIFVDSIRTQFMDPNDFIQQWIKGLLDKYENYSYKTRDGIERKYILINLLQNDYFREYTLIFLERNFYRNLVARTRFKPDDILWELWFGNGNFVLGIFMTPVFRSGKWTNDVSEIRRANYKYWTIGHIMKTGIIDPESNIPITFLTYDNLFIFYRSILKKLSNSLYEKEVFERYIDYLNASENIDEEPLLIPEIRYAGLNKDHKHRLDFTILNSHTQEYIGFELSPSSSHMAVSGIRSGKSQNTMNQELSEKWDKEMTKRNDYFSSYGITTLTFTDEHLANMDDVFENIAMFLRKRDVNRTSISNQIDRLMKL